MYRNPDRIPQLPPVAPAKFAFESTAWTLLDPVMVTLTRVFRQTDPTFAALLSEIRIACPSPAALARLNGRRSIRPPAGVIPTRLRGTNREVDAVNMKAFESLTGTVRTFNAVDDGAGEELRTLQRGCPAAAILRLRLGTAVILLKNLEVTRGLVNGSPGVVVGFGETCGADAGVWVEFGASAERHLVVPSEWTVLVGGTIRARRRQIPLRLAYAITVHRAQGMQLQHVDVSTEGIFEYGRFGKLLALRIFRWSNCTWL